MSGNSDTGAPHHLICNFFERSIHECCGCCSSDFNDSTGDNDFLTLQQSLSSSSILVCESHPHPRLPGSLASYEPDRYFSGWSKNRLGLGSIHYWRYFQTFSLVAILKLSMEQTSRCFKTLQSRQSDVNHFLRDIIAKYNSIPTRQSRSAIRFKFRNSTHHPSS